MNEIRLEFSFIWLEVYFCEFVEQELERSYVFDLAMLVGRSEDLIGRAHDIAVVLDSTNFNVLVPGLGSFKRCIYGNWEGYVGECGALGPSSFPVAKMSKSTAGFGHIFLVKFGRG